MTDLRVQVVPKMSTTYAKASVFSNRIRLSNMLVAESSDVIIRTSIMHELGHLKHRRQDILMVLFFYVFFVETCLLLLPCLLALIPCLMFLYISLCAYFRSQEHQADLYMLAVCGENDAFEFMMDMRDHEKRRIRLLHLFYLHPSVSERLQYLFNLPGDKT